MLQQCFLHQLSTLPTSQAQTKFSTVEYADHHNHLVTFEDKEFCHPDLLPTKVVVQEQHSPPLYLLL
jgi:hypothetical protein